MMELIFDEKILSMYSIHTKWQVYHWLVIGYYKEVKKLIFFNNQISVYKTMNILNFIGMNFKNFFSLKKNSLSLIILLLSVILLRPFLVGEGLISPFILYYN